MAFKSLDDLRDVASKSDTIEIENSDIRFLIEQKNLNSLLFTEPLAKLCFNAVAVSEFLRDGNVLYIDFDTAFTSYVKNGVFPFSMEKNELLIYLPSTNEFEEMLADICSAINSDTNLIIIDSLNSFYHLYDRIKIGSLNHLLSSYVSLLLNYASRCNSRLLVTSMIRHKKKTEWVLAPSSQRLIESKSGVILRAELNQDLSINLLKHGKLKMNSKLVLSKKQIPIVP